MGVVLGAGFVESGEDVATAERRSPFVDTEPPVTFGSVSFGGATATCTAEDGAVDVVAVPGKEVECTVFKDPIALTDLLDGRTLVRISPGCPLADPVFNDAVLVQ